MSNRKIYLLSFADTRWEPTLLRLKKQASDFKCFDKIFLFNEKDLGQDFYQRFKKILRKRGYGFWVWKSYLTMKILNDLKNDDILIYIDAGCYINAKGKRRFLDYINLLDKDESGILTFQGLGEEYKWTKGDVFDNFKVRSDSHIFSSGQIYAGCFLIRKCSKSLNAINLWYNTFVNHLSLVDDSPSISPNFDGFIEHRFDQSIFSIITKMNNCIRISDKEVCNYDRQWLDMDDFPFQVRRDKKMKLSSLIIHRLSSPKRILQRFLKNVAKNS